MKKTLVFAALFACIATTHAQFWKEKSTSAKQVSYITNHPAAIVLKGDGTEKSFFLFSTNEGYFFTQDEELAQKITDHVPEEYMAGKAVMLGGSAIKAFTKIKKSQLAKISKRTGRKLNKKDDVFIITEYSFLDDYDPTKKSKSSSGTMRYNPPGN